MNKVTVLRALPNTMKRAGITSMTIIGKARVPVTKFVTARGHLSVSGSGNFHVLRPAGMKPDPLILAYFTMDGGCSYRRNRQVDRSCARPRSHNNWTPGSRMATPPLFLHVQNQGPHQTGPRSSSLPGPQESWHDIHPLLTFPAYVLRTSELLLSRTRRGVLR